MTFDTPEDNWKNSEVMRNFVEFYPTEEKSISAEADSQIQVEAFSEEFDEKYDYFDDMYNQVTLQALGNIDTAISRLSSVAQSAADNGNIKAAYLVERTMQALRDVEPNLMPEVVSNEIGVK